MSIFDFKIKDGVLFKYRGWDTNVVIPEGVTEIGGGAFENCKKIQSVSFPKDLRIIGASSFENCTSLSELTVPESVIWILDAAFKNCTSLKSVRLLCSVNSIYYNAFSNCTSLKSVELLGRVNHIGVSAFGGCSALESISIPDTVYGIGGLAFYGCKSLTEVRIPASVREIASHAFKNCSNATIVIDGKVNKIADDAFEGCKEVVYQEEKTPADKSAVEDAPAEEPVAEVAEEAARAEPAREMQNAEFGVQNDKSPETKAPAATGISTDENTAPKVKSEGYVFISYSTKNQDYAEAALRLVKEDGISAWMAPYDIPAGSKYAHVINSAIKNCSCVLLLLSEQSQESEWVEKEIERAINYKKTIISMHIDESQLNDGFSFYLGNQQIVPIKSINKNDSNIQKVLDAVRSFVR